MSRISTCIWPSLENKLLYPLSSDFSNVNHLQELKDSGLEMPAVNQIEVSTLKTCWSVTPELSHLHSSIHSINRSLSSTFATLTGF